MKSLKREPPGHSNVQQGIVEEYEAVVRRICTDEHVGGLLVLRDTFGDSVGV